MVAPVVAVFFAVRTAAATVLTAGTVAVAAALAFMVFVMMTVTSTKTETVTLMVLTVTVFWWGKSLDSLVVLDILSAC